MTFVIKNNYGSIEYFDNDEEMLKQRESNLFFEQEFVLTVLSEYIQSSKVALDIGAHCGSHTILYKKINPDLTVFAFEPQKAMYSLLTSNIKANDISGVHLYNNAVGHFIGDAHLNKYSSDGTHAFETVYYDDERVFNLAGLSIGSGGELVKMVTIDSLMLSCDFMKIDVEGYEPFVLQGAVETIERCKPVISFEYNEKTCGSDISSFHILDDLGYSYHQVSKDNWIAL